MELFVARTAADVREALRMTADGVGAVVLLQPCLVVAPACRGGSPAVRAAAVTLALGTTATLAFRTALWVHTGGPPPAVPEVIEAADVVPGARTRRTRLRRADVETIGGTPVTTPARTAADLARDLPRSQALAALTRLGDHTGVTADDVARHLDTVRTARNAATARRLLREWRARAPACR